MRIKSRFVLITGGFLIAVVFYQIGRARQPDKTKKFYLDGPNPDSGKFKVTGSNDDSCVGFMTSLFLFRYSPQAKSYVLNFS